MANRVAVRARGARRRTHWTAAAGAVSLTATNNALLTSLPTGHEGETIVRIRGHAHAFLLTAAAVGDGFSGAFGVALVTAAAAAAGIASVPTPIAEAAWDGWMLHQFFDVRSGLVDTGAPGSQSMILDSKAMRKANEDESLVFIVEVVEDGTATMDFLFRARILSMIG